MDPEVPHAVADLLREVMPWTINVLVPPGWDERYIETFGFTMEDLGEQGAASLETKLRSAGMPLEELPGPPVMPLEGTRASARCVGRRLEGRLPGEKTGPPSRDPEHVQLVRVGCERPRRRRPARPRADPVGLRRSRAVARRGRQRLDACRPRGDRQPDSRFRVLVRGLGRRRGDRKDPRRLMLRGRFLPRGDLAGSSRAARFPGWLLLPRPTTCRPLGTELRRLRYPLAWPVSEIPPGRPTYTRPVPDPERLEGRATGCCSG